MANRLYLDEKFKNLFENAVKNHSQYNDLIGRSDNNLYVINFFINNELKKIDEKLFYKVVKDNNEQNISKSTLERAFRNTNSSDGCTIEVATLFATFIENEHISLDEFITSYKIEGIDTTTELVENDELTNKQKPNKKLLLSILGVCLALIIILFIILLNLNNFPKTIYGVVVNDKGTPIEGAKIKCEQHPYAVVYSNEDGLFAISNKDLIKKIIRDKSTQLIIQSKNHESKYITVKNIGFEQKDKLHTIELKKELKSIVDDNNDIKTIEEPNINEQNYYGDIETVNNGTINNEYNNFENNISDTSTINEPKHKIIKEPTFYKDVLNYSSGIVYYYLYFNLEENEKNEPFIIEFIALNRNKKTEKIIGSIEINYLNKNIYKYQIDLCEAKLPNDNYKFAYNLIYPKTGNTVRKVSSHIELVHKCNNNQETLNSFIIVNNKYSEPVEITFRDPKDMNFGYYVKLKINANESKTIYNAPLGVLNYYIHKSSTEFKHHLNYDDLGQVLVQENKNSEININF